MAPLRGIERVGGPVTITGKTGKRQVTHVAVPAGRYILTDSHGPRGYTTGHWICDAGVLTGNTLQLPLGADVTCTVTQYKDLSRVG